MRYGGKVKSMRGSKVGREGLGVMRMVVEGEWKWDGVEEGARYCGQNWVMPRSKKGYRRIWRFVQFFRTRGLFVDFFKEEDR